MSHPTSFWHALWDGLRTLYRNLRRAVGTDNEHSGEALVVQASLATIEETLGRHYFAPNWEFSYYKRGEQLNLARIEYDQRDVHGHEYVWWQTHVRGWERGDGSVRLRAHYELEPTEYDQDHIDGIGADVGIAVDTVAAILDDADLSYDRFEHLPAGGEQ